MNFEELGIFVLMVMVSLSILTIAVGFTVRVFLSPVLREAVERLGSRAGGNERTLAARLDRLDDRLASLEEGLERMEATQDFDRRLGTGGPRSVETA